MEISLLALVGAGGCLLATVALVWVALTYNKLVRQRNQASASWAQIDVQLKRRHDLIPNLVETVRGYASHERATLESVIQARSGAMTAGASTADRAGAENLLTQTLGRLFALAEQYPELRANHNFIALQQELATTEDKIAYARQFYNSAVQTLTNTIQAVPSNLVAGMFRFLPPDYFETADRERGPVRVQF